MPLSPRAALLSLGALVAATACGDATPTAPAGAGPSGRPVLNRDDGTSSSVGAASTALPHYDAGPSVQADAAAAPDAAIPHATVRECFMNLVGPVKAPDYDQYKPRMGAHCAGTAQQKITGVERLVFLGDSITAGTPPTPVTSYYRELVVTGVRARFGPQVTVTDCSRWGARLADLTVASGPTQPAQIAQCFPGGVEARRTLVVMTMGGNDISAWAKDQLPSPAATAAADDAATKLREALDWLKSPTHFPNGSYVVFGNPYEYTDTSGDILSCPTAGLSGFKANYAEGTAAVVRFQERFMEHAVATQTDVVFLLESFCGHGYRRGDPKLQCYRGPNAELWFDLTCYHPNPVGHAKIAEAVLRVIDG